MIRTSGARAQQRVGEIGARAHHVLAVVEDQERLARLQVRAERLGERLPGLLAHGQHLRRVVRDERGILIGARSMNQTPSG